MNCAIHCILVALLTCGVGATAQNILTNGSFEDYGGTGFNSNIGAGIYGWTIGAGGGIDIVLSTGTEPSYWQAADGDVSLSLNWAAPESISQTVTTSADKAYHLSFAMAAEIYGGPASRTMEVLWNGMVVDTPSFQYTGQGPTNMGWVEFTCDVLATGNDTLMFHSTTPGSYGPTLDHVMLVPGGYRLEIHRLEELQTLVTWSTNASGYVLESTPSLPAVTWSVVTNAVEIVGNKFAVTVDTTDAQQFFRLHKP